MAIETNYFDVAKKCLVESCAQRDSIAAEMNLNIEAALLVNVAIAALSKDGSGGCGITSAKPCAEASNPLAEKVNAFIQQKSFSFARVDPFEWGFSLLPKSSDTGLVRSWEEKASWVTHLFKDGWSVWISEEELNARFTNCLEHIETYYIAEGCHDLYAMANKPAAYYLLCLIKYVTQGTFKIPAAFTESTVKQVLSSLIANKAFLTFPFKLAEILFIPWGWWESWQNGRNWGSIWPFYMALLDEKQHSAFLDFTEECLKVTPHDVWPAKWQILMDYLRMVEHPKRVALAQALSTSEDAQIGEHLLQALQASSFREQIPHFYALKQVLPHSYEWNIEIIFGRPFVELRQPPERCYKEDPSFTRRLCFKDRVFFEENLVIGVYHPERSHRVPPHLLAYDVDTENMVWGMALTPSMQTNTSLISSYPANRKEVAPVEGDSRIARWGNFLTLHFKGSSIVTLIDPKTGTITSTIDLQYSPDEFHLTSDGLYCYQRIWTKEKQILAGGTVLLGKWTECFQQEHPYGAFIPLLSHLGLLDKQENKLHLFGQKGYLLTIENCLSAYGEGNTLYFIQAPPDQENTCFLHRATVTSEKEMISEKQACIPLNTRKASILKICSNGLIVLLDESSRSPLFFTPQNTVIYHQSQISKVAKYIVNAETGDIWCSTDPFNRVGTNTVRKITPTEDIPMGELQSRNSITPLHVDSKGRFYFMTPYS